MARKYFNRGEFGLYRLEKQPGVILSDISDVSSDSEAPQEGRWRPPSPGAQARLEDEARKLAYEMDETNEDPRLKMTSIILSGIRRRRARHRERNRARNPRSNMERGLWTPETSRSPRSPSPDSIVPGNPITADEQIDFGAELQNEIQFHCALSGWNARNRDREARRIKRDQRVRDRVLEWIDQMKGKAYEEDRITQPLQKVTPELKASVEAIWERRFHLLKLKLRAPTGEIDRTFLHEISPHRFYEIYLTLPPTALEYFHRKFLESLRLSERGRRKGDTEPEEHYAQLAQKEARARERRDRQRRDQERSLMDGRIEEIKANQSNDKHAMKNLGGSILTPASFRDHAQQFIDSKPLDALKGQPPKRGTAIVEQIPAPKFKRVRSEDEQDVITRARSEEPPLKKVRSLHHGHHGYQEGVQNTITRTSTQCLKCFRRQSPDDFIDGKNPRVRTVLGGRLDKSRSRKASRILEECNRKKEKERGK